MVNFQHAWLEYQFSTKPFDALRADVGTGPYNDGYRASVEPNAHEVAHWICLGEPTPSKVSALLSGAPRYANRQEAMAVALELDALACLGMLLSERTLVDWAASGMAKFFSDLGGWGEVALRWSTGSYKRWLRREMAKVRATKAHAKRVKRFVQIVEQGRP